MDLEVKVYNKLVEKGIVGTSLKYIEELINIVDEHRSEQLNLPVVSQQRELLKGFIKYANSTDTTNHIYVHLLEDFLKTL